MRVMMIWRRMKTRKMIEMFLFLVNIVLCCLGIAENNLVQTEFLGVPWNSREFLGFPGSWLMRNKWEFRGTPRYSLELIGTPGNSREFHSGMCRNI